MIKNGMQPVHPGEILFEEFMKPAEPSINANRLAKALDVPSNRITAVACPAVCEAGAHCRIVGIAKDPASRLTGGLARGHSRASDRSAGK
jgi:hypothetical protein